MFARWTIFVALLSLAVATRAQAILSQSRQFVIHSQRGATPLEKIPAGALALEPELLAVTAERIKHALAAEIPALAQSRDQIHLGIMDVLAPESNIGVAATRYTDGWNYNVAIPRIIDHQRLVKSLINVILVEYANRNGQRSLDFPAWISEGFAQQILHTVGPSLIVDRRNGSWEAAVRDMLEGTRNAMRTNSAPSFQDVTTANVPSARSQGELLYQASTHLLVHSLLAQPHGRQNFARFLQALPSTWNWQTAFRQSFGFERMLDAEKWWALTVVEFTTRDERQAWSKETSLRRLDELLYTRLQYHSSTNALPEDRQVNLTAVLRDIEWNVQEPALKEKVSQLNYTAAHLAPAVGALAIGYKQALESYLSKRATASLRPGLRTTPEAQTQVFIAEAVRRIETLDAKRKALGEATMSSLR